MKLEYTVKHIYGNKFTVLYSIPLVGGKNMEMAGNFTFTGFSLEKCLAQARAVISSRLYALRKAGMAIPPTANIQTVWNENASEMPEHMQKQQRYMASMFSAPAELRGVETPQEEQPTEPALYEIVQVKGVWTLNKHERPLMTWEQACELLKQKVENND